MILRCTNLMPVRPSIHLFHWNKDEAAPLLAKLEKAGYAVVHHVQVGGLSVRAMSSACAVVIDLSRLPSLGRAVGSWLRGSKSTRHIPVIFVDGVAEKVAMVKQQLPDAIFTTHRRLVAALKQAITPFLTPDTPVLQPVVPPAMMQSYGARTTAQKLGIGDGMRVRLIDPPAQLIKVLGELPRDVEFDETAACPITLWFVREPASFQFDLMQHRVFAKRSKLWIIWKKGDRLFNGNTARETALAMGLVDYKICSLDSTWSGMLFAVKKSVMKKGAT